MSELVCKGSWSLKTACGKCEKCHKSAPGYIKQLEQDFNMYVNAWLREVGRTFPKSHLIDALVVTTRDLKRKADRFDREFAQDMPRWQYSEMAAPWFELPAP